MTDYDASDDVEALVEDTELPRRLRNQVYETIEDRDPDLEAVNEICQAVEARYLDTRVDPLDPVGTVSAQSIGEPGTQMSLPGDEAIVTRRNGQTATEEIGGVVDDALESTPTAITGDHEVGRPRRDIEVLSLGADEEVAWCPVEEVSRHDAPAELLEFELESGRTIRATKSHSFVTRRDNEVVPVAGADLDPGDWLPVAGAFDVPSSQETLDLRPHLPADEYWHTSLLTDGGVASHPGGEEQVRNKRAALAAGDLERDAIYPWQGTVSLPQALPLDAETGFFVGAFLAEGNLTDHYVSISNVDPAFQDRIRSFADRFDLSLNEYDNESGFATGHDIRVNGTILADLLETLCTSGGEKVVPGFAFGASDAFVSGFLGGYFAGDGNVGKRSVRASSTSGRLIVGISLLLARIGVYATLGRQDGSRTLRIPSKYLPTFEHEVELVGDRADQLTDLVHRVDADGPDATDQIPSFGDDLKTAASRAGIPNRQVNSAHDRQRIGRNRLAKLVDEMDEAIDGESEAVEALRSAVAGDAVWERIEAVRSFEPDDDYVYDVSVGGLDTFTTAQGVVTHNTMNTFHYAGVAEIDVTQGLPRLIELVDARKEPDTPMMTVHLEDEYAADREKAHEVVWKIEATKILQLGDVSTNVADMLVQIALNEDTLMERWPTVDDPGEIAGEIAETIESSLGVTARRDGLVIEFGPEEPSYRDLLQLVEELREIVFKGIEDVTRVVIRKEERGGQGASDGDEGEEFVLYTEGSDFGKVLDIEGVDASRTTCNNI
ncbi:MAG: DNA-directed RNA polymerase subunit A'', partial [Haloarculaceae archaeon]